MTFLNSISNDDYSPRLQMTQENMNKSKKLDAFCCCSSIFVLLLLEYVFFRNVMMSPQLIGDEGDGRLTMLITEHWFHFIRGKQSFGDLGFFYPVQDTLAYSDMLLGFGIVHSILRFVGVDIYDAYKITLIVIHILGSISCWYLLKKVVNVNYFWSLFGTVAFSFSNAYAANTNHTQLLALSMVPLLVTLGVRFFQNIDIRLKRNAYAYAAIIQLLLILYTAWYIFFFIALFTTVAVIIWFIGSLGKKDKFVSQIGSLIKTLNYDIIGYLLVAGALMIPFVKLELNALQISGGRTYNGVFYYQPEIIDIVHVPASNFMMGKWITSLKLDQRVGIENGEMSMGFSPVLLILLMIVLTRHCVSKSRQPDKTVKLSIVCLEAVLICLLLTVRLSSNGVSLWKIVFNVFPGAKSIRAVSRFFLFLNLPMAVCTSILCDYYFDKYKDLFHGEGWARAASCGIVFILLVMSNLDIKGVPANWNKEISNQLLADIEMPPEDCKAFYVINCTKKGSSPVLSLDGYQIADSLGLKTLNGYSGFAPPEYGDVFKVDSEGYEAAVIQWIIRHGLDGIFSYDETFNKWEKVDLSEYMRDVFDLKTHQTTGLYIGLKDKNPQGDYSWTGKNFEIWLKSKDISENECLLLKYETIADWYDIQNPGGEKRLSIFVNGEHAMDLPVGNEYREQIIPVKKTEDDIYHIKFEASFYFYPTDVLKSTDARELSWRLYYLGPQIESSEHQ